MMQPVDQPGWIRHQWRFWRGQISAGPGPAQQPSPLTATGGSVAAGTDSPNSVDSQTYPFSVNGGDPPTRVVARQPTRKSLTIENNSNATIQVFFGPNSVNVANTNLGLLIKAGDVYQPRTGVPVDEIYVSTPGVSASGVIITGA